MEDAAVAIALGLVIGCVAGLFGIGGSSLGTPLLRIFLSTPRLVALASPLPVTLPAALAGSVVYRGRGLINVRVAVWTVAVAAPMVVLGALLTAWVPEAWLLFGIAGTVVLAGVRLLAPQRADVPARSSDVGWAGPPRAAIVVTAAVTGLLAGLLANGGGFLLVPAFVLLFGARVREAAATSLPCIAALSIPGTVTHAALGHVDVWLSLEMTLGAVPAAYLAARLSVRLRQRVRLRRPFGVVMSVFGVYFFVRELLVTL